MPDPLVVMGAGAVTARLLIWFLTMAMAISWGPLIVDCVLQRPGWRVHLNTTVLFGLGLSASIINAGQVWADAGRAIDPAVRLFLVSLGLWLFVVCLLTGFYRRAFKAGPEAARVVLLLGCCVVLLSAGLAALLILGRTV